MEGNGALFAREDVVEAAWAVGRTNRAGVNLPARKLGPPGADGMLTAAVGWFNPTPGKRQL